MHRKTSLVLGCYVAVLLFFVRDVLAVGSAGYKNEVVNAEAMGKASSFVAQADNPSAIYYNPAGLTQLKGDNVSLGYTFEGPMAEVESNTADGTVQMQRQVFWIPNFYYVSDANKENLRIGFSVTSPFGLATDWAQDSYVAANATESDLDFIAVNPTIAFKVNDVLSIGAGLNHFGSHLSKHKRVAASISSDGDFQLKGSDTGWGYNTGFLVQPSEQHSIGISYRSEVDMDYKGTVSMTNINQGAYPAVFGGASYSTDMKVSLTLPQSVVIGYAYKPGNKWTFETDLEWTGWSAAEEEKVEYPSESDANRLAVLNAGNPVPRDWNDVFSFGVGAEYQATDKLALRCGYLYEETPIPSANLDAALPDADRHGVTLGFGYDFKEVTIDASYLALFMMDRDVTNDVGLVAGTDIDGKYKQFVNVFAVGFTYKF